MLTRRTIIGNVVGGAITALGVVALALAFGIQETGLDEAILSGGSTVYEFDAPAGAAESVTVSGTAFEVTLRGPGGEDVTSPYKDGTVLEWTVERDGSNRIEVRNTGPDEVLLTGTLQHLTDPLLYTYHIMVIVAGIVIIGFSAGFSVRKPKGF